MRNEGIEGYAALQSTGNGNCLFNSVTVVQFGDESKAMHGTQSTNYIRNDSQLTNVQYNVRLAYCLSKLLR